MNVMRWIEHPPRPTQLLLVWQAPHAHEDRLRWVVGRISEAGAAASFEYLMGEEFIRFNAGRSFEDLKSAGYSGYPAFDLRKRAQGPYRDRVVEAFLRRLPASTRADFSSYLEHYHVKKTTPLSPLALLAITEARLPSDGFSLIDPLDEGSECVDLVFEIAGFRHYQEAGATMALGDRLELCKEPGNPRDPLAIQVLATKRTIGYVNRLQAHAIGEWLTAREVNCWVARINGRVGAPRAYAFLQVRSSHCRLAA